MKRTFHVWNRELKIVTQIILNTSFWENFTENGRSQIFTFFEKKMTFYHCTLCADIFRAGGLFFIHCTAVKHPYSISSYFFKPKEDCLWRLYERRLFCLSLCLIDVFLYLYMLWTPIEIARGRPLASQVTDEKMFSFYFSFIK